MNKKGAIEFSMTTIMIIIIGIAVLALGLAWVRGTFERVGTLTESALDNAETIFGEVGFTGRIGAPATILMKGDDAKKFRVYVRNNNPIGGATVSAKLTTLEGHDSGNCLEVISTSTGTVSLAPGETTELGGGVVSTGCNVGDSGIITVVVKDGSNDYATEAIAVRVE